MMIKNNIWNILLVIFAFFWAYFSLAYLDVREAQKEAVDEKKYQEFLETSFVEWKTADLDEVFVLSWQSVWNEGIRSDEEEIIDDEDNALNEQESIDDSVGNEYLRSDEKDIIDSEEIIDEPVDSEEIISSDEENTPSAKNIVQDNLLGIHTQNKLSDVKDEDAEIKTFPKEVNTSMNFHSQSPLWTWGEIFWDTCEEASVLLAYLYFEWITVTATEFRDELLRLVDYQNDVFWDFKHTTVNQTAQLLKDYYKYDNFKILDNPTAEDLKYNIAKGSVILAPFYGVGMNPYYSGRGPEYHFMVIKWYTEDTFITHDVGTRRGENYEYKIETIMERLHDYHPESVQLWAKRVIVVSAR